MSSQLQLWPESRPNDRLRWSISRDRRLQDCHRKYYLYHYAGVGGKHASANSLARDVYVLKHLRNRFMWVGEVVHELLEQALHAFRRGENVSPQALIAQGTRRMRATYAASLQGLYRDNPGGVAGLIEHEYAERISRDEWRAMRARMQRCVENFFKAPLVQEVRQVPAFCWLALEATGTFDEDGATIVVKPDLAWRGDNGRVMLLDWKTGQPHPEEDRLQMAVYGAFAQRVWGLGPEALRAHLVYLDTGEVAAFELHDEDLQTAMVRVRESVHTMRHLGQQVTQQSAAAAMATFAQTDNPQTCQRCTFRRVCHRDMPQGAAIPRPARVPLAATPAP